MYLVTITAALQVRPRHTPDLLPLPLSARLLRPRLFLKQFSGRPASHFSIKTGSIDCCLTRFNLKLPSVPSRGESDSSLSLPMMRIEVDISVVEIVSIVSVFAVVCTIGFDTGRDFLADFLRGTLASQKLLCCASGKMMEIRFLVKTRGRV